MIPRDCNVWDSYNCSFWFVSCSHSPYCSSCSFDAHFYIFKTVSWRSSVSFALSDSASSFVAAPDEGAIYVKISLQNRRSSRESVSLVVDQLFEAPDSWQLESHCFELICLDLPVRVAQQDLLILPVFWRDKKHLLNITSMNVLARAVSQKNVE